MENGADALLIAFAVLIFIIALSVALSTLAQAKSTADVVLFYSDRENFQTPLTDELNVVQNGGRKVGIDTVIATIYRCAKEKFTVRIIEDGVEKYKFEYDISNNVQIKEEVAKFIKNNALTSQFIETYVETIIRGDIDQGEDGTSLERNTVKKLYITYQKI